MKKFDVNSPFSVAAFAALAPVAAAVLLIMPLYVGAIIGSLSFEASKASFFASAEMAGMGLAAIPALYWVNKISWRVVARAALISIFVANLLSAVIDSFGTLLVLRFLAGLAGGSLMSVVMASIGQTAKPDRNFGLWIMSQLVFATIAFSLLPGFVASGGVDVIFSLIAVMAFVGLVATVRIPVGPCQGDATTKKPPTVLAAMTTTAIMGLIAVGAYYAGISSVWAFLQQVGIKAGISAQSIGASLAFSSLAGIAGAFAATVIGVAFGRWRPIVVGIGSLTMSIVIFAQYPTLTLFAIAAALFVFFWNFTIPFYLGSLATVDKTGALMVLSNAAIGLGISAGPLIAGLFLSPRDFSASHIVGALLLMMSASLIAKLSIRPRET